MWFTVKWNAGLGNYVCVWEITQSNQKVSPSSAAVYMYVYKQFPWDETCYSWAYSYVCLQVFAPLRA